MLAGKLYRPVDVCEVVIGEGAQIGPAVQIYAADHPASRPNVTPGWNSGVRCGLAGTIGDHAIVAAGSVVTRDVAAGSTVKGNPARPKLR